MYLPQPVGEFALYGTALFITLYWEWNHKRKPSGITTLNTTERLVTFTVCKLSHACLMHLTVLSKVLVKRTLCRPSSMLSVQTRKKVFLKKIARGMEPKKGWKQGRD